jgi:hypothetical protein
MNSTTILPGESGIARQALLVALGEQQDDRADRLAGKR